MSAPSQPAEGVIGNLKMGGGVQIADDAAMRAAVGSLMGDVADPHFKATVESTLREMAAGAGASTAGGADAADPVSDGHLAASVFSSLATHSGAAGAEAIASTLGMLGRLTDGTGEGADAAAATEGLSDALMGKMMAEFEEMGGKEDFAAVTDNMMRQLLSKDIMYVPMKSIGERFPDWLATHSQSLSKEEYVSRAGEGRRAPAPRLTHPRRARDTHRRTTGACTSASRSSC